MNVRRRNDDPFLGIVIGESIGTAWFEVAVEVVLALDLVEVEGAGVGQSSIGMIMPVESVIVDLGRKDMPYVGTG